MITGYHAPRTVYSEEEHKKDPYNTIYVRTEYVPQLFIAIMNGYLEDQIGCMPVLKWAKHQFNEIDLRVATLGEFSFLYTDTFIANQEYVIDFTHGINPQSLPNIVSFDGRIKEIRTLQMFLQDDNTPIRSHIMDYIGVRWFGSIIPKNFRSMQKILPQQPSLKLESLIKKYDLNLSNTVLLDISFKFKSRKFDENVLSEFISWLLSRGNDIILLGYKEKSEILRNISIENLKVVFNSNSRVFDFSSLLSLKDQIYLLQNCHSFVGMNGDIAALASLTDIPMVVGFSSENYEYRIPWRNDIKGWKVYPVYNKVGCKFCFTDLYISDWMFDQCYTFYFIDKKRKYECTKINLEYWQQAFLKMEKEKNE